VALANQKYLLLTYLHNVQNKVFIVPLESLENALSPSLDANGHAMNGDTHTNGPIKTPTKTDDSASEIDNEWIGLEDAEQVAFPVGCSVSNKTCRRDDPRIFINCVGLTLAGRVYKYKFHCDESWGESNDSPTESKSETMSLGELSIWRDLSIDGFVPNLWTAERLDERTEEQGSDTSSLIEWEEEEQNVVMCDDQPAEEENMVTNPRIEMEYIALGSSQLIGIESSTVNHLVA
jgi:hypothetical protein